MAKVPPDLSFVREGLPLRDWLPRLVDEDEEIRAGAVNAIRAMHSALPSVRTSLLDLDRGEIDFDVHATRLKSAIHAVVAEPGFDRADFVRRLCASELAGDQSWQDYLDARREGRRVRDEKFDRLSEPLINEINDPSDEAAKAEAMNRFAQLVRAYVCGGRENKPKIPGGLIVGGVVRNIVFGSLEAHIMAAPEAVEALLGSKRARHYALRMIKSAGPTAISLAPRLLAEMDAAPESDRGKYSHAFGEEATALGAIGCGNIEIVDAMIRRLASAHVFIRDVAAMTLKSMEGELSGRNESAVRAILPMLDSDESCHVAIAALASIGRHDAGVRKLIIDLAGLREPRLVRHPQFPNYTYDAANVKRGSAINAMAYFKDYAPECLPTLIDAIETFVELDSDYDRAGPLARIASVLQRFGAAAGIAAVPLARHLEVEGENTPPRGVLDALVAIGPAAKEALPLLEDYRARHLPKKSAPVNAAGRILRRNDPVGWAIQQISQS